MYAYIDYSFKFLTHISVYTIIYWSTITICNISLLAIQQMFVMQ